MKFMTVDAEHYAIVKALRFDGTPCWQLIYVSQMHGSTKFVAENESKQALEEGLKFLTSPEG